MKHILMLILASIVLLPFTVGAQEQTPASFATICLHRKHKFTGSALELPVYLDQREVHHLRNGENVQLIVSPGEHKIYSDRLTGIDIDMKAGQTYYMLMDIVPGSAKNGHGVITLIDPLEGQHEFSRVKLIPILNLTRK